MRNSLVILIILFSGCDAPVQQPVSQKRDPAGEQFVKVNRYIQQRHQDHIGAFVDRAGWDARVTESGLWLVVRDSGMGPRIREGDRVAYDYRSLLLDGTECYQSAPGSPKRITVGQGGVESGVEEGLRHLRPGSEAIFLIPPHLGHGNFGDRDRIPGNSVLIYTLEILEVDQDG